MKLLPLILLLLLISGCQNKTGNKSSVTTPPEKDLIELNRSFISKDSATIAQYITSNDLAYKMTGTGLWYSVIAEGSGEKVKTGDNVTYDYKCTLIDGTPCYSGSQKIHVGYTSTESGVTEGLQLMQKGSDYMFIIPPYLAFGLTGDGNKIPGRSILIYRIRIREIN